jgi:protein phosphatase
MLICPHCQFENQDNKESCEKCGTSLTHQNCHVCGTKVPYGTERCPSCDAVTGNHLWAVITRKLGKEKDSIADLLYSGEYIDEGKRYRLLANELPEREWDTSSKTLAARAFDCLPLQKSKLDALLEHLEEQAANSGELKRLWSHLGIPPLALPYLTLVEDFSPAIPEIFDAWQDGERDIILLCDRSFYESFLNFWQQQNLGEIEVIEYLDELARLWQGLSAVRCCQSLLTESNLLIDEEQNLCLQELIPDLPGTDINLKHLEDLVYKLLNNSDKNFEGFLDPLMAKITKGEFESAEQLRSALAAIKESITQSETPQQPNLEVPKSGDENAIADVPNFEDMANIPLGQDHEEEEEEDQERTVVAGSSDELSTLMLPVQILSLGDAACSDIGRQRVQNEDYYGIQTQTDKQQSPRGIRYRARGLYVVCDGMGGHSAGEVASTMGVQAIQRYFKAHWRGGHGGLPDANTIRKAVIGANNYIYQVNAIQKKSGNKRMGTTLALALVEDTKVAIAHVGDSRIYSVTRRLGLQCLTRDHCVAQMEIRRGVPADIAYARPEAYQLTQALGPRDNHLVDPDIHFFDVKEDTLLLLCSDGLYDNEFVENYWQTHLLPLLSSKEDLEQGVIKLVGLANEYNGHDNLTGVLVRIKIQPDLSKKSR